MPLTDAKIRALRPGPKQRVFVDGLGLELLVTPAGAKRWYFRYRLAGRQQRLALGPYPELGLAAARQLAADKRTMIRRGEDPRGPAPTAALEQPEHETVDDAIDSYLDAHREVWRASTARTYRSAIGAFRAWASASKILTVDQITARALASYRAHAVSSTRRAKAKGGSRSDVADTGQRRSASAINCELRAVKTLLNTLLDAERLPALTTDAIRKTIKLVDGDEQRPRPLRPAQLRELLAACRRHDLEHEPIAPLVITMLLGGLRLGEALRLQWADVDLDEQVIRMLSTKTKHERDVDLAVSPALIRVLEQLHRDGSARVFRHTQPTALDARRRLIDDYGAPAFLWSTRHSRPGERSAPTLRSTCGCYLTCAPGIYGGASLYLSAARLGHSAEVAQRHYLGALRRIPADAKTIEAAMGVEAEIERLLGASGRLRVVG